MKNLQFVSRITLVISVFTLLLTTFLFVKTKLHSVTQTKSIESTNTSLPIALVATKTIVGIDPLERESVKFSALTQGLEPMQECLPVLIEGQTGFDLEYLYCTDNALANDGKSKTLTANFTVTAGLARRYNFWRRIYSHFSSKQHILHLVDYPEVVLEIYDLSKYPVLAYQEQRHLVREIADRRKQYYQQLFNQLYQNRDSDISTYSPDMRRIAKIMAHISDVNKYLIAANSMRTQTGQRDYLASGILQGYRYLTEIEDEFDRQGIPRELARLAFVESSFNINAKSKVGASGIYQIMFKTGKQYLKIADGIDERNDPIKASRAAAKLLRMNYAVTQSWPLAITAYNHGIGSIKRAVRMTGSIDMETIIREYQDKNFGFASKNFYTEYLAMLGTLQDAERLFPTENSQDPIAFSTVTLKNAMSIAEIRKKHRISDAQIGDLNPDILRLYIRKNGILPRGYTLKIPVAKTSAAAIYSGGRKV